MKKVDFSQFDYIFGMDDENIDDLTSMAPADSKAKVELLGSYDPQGERIIRDPYYVSCFLHFILNFKSSSALSYITG